MLPETHAFTIRRNRQRLWGLSGRWRCFAGFFFRAVAAAAFIANGHDWLSWVEWFRFFHATLVAEKKRPSVQHQGPLFSEEN
jgi:hypothetical protein